MARTKLENLGFTVKENGRIDFDKPPKGKIFVPVPTSEEDIRDREIDRSFVAWHTFSATTMLCVMELVDDSEAEKAKAYVAGIKADCKKEERERRCRIINPKTGRKIMCPESISCYSDECPKKKGLQVWTNAMASLDGLAETVRDSVYDEDPVANGAISGCMWESFKKRLREENEDLVRIIEWDETGFTGKEILRKLNRKETDTSWYAYQWKRIRKRWEEYNID